MEFGFFIDNETGVIAPQFNAGDFLQDNTFETAIILSLFSDCRVGVEELPAGDTKRRGFWGDLFPDVEGDQWGSKLWTLERSKISSENIPLIEARAAQALAWLIEDGAAKSVDVSAELIDNRLKLSITIVKPDNDANRFGFVWDEQRITRA